MAIQSMMTLAVFGWVICLALAVFFGALTVREIIRRRNNREFEKRMQRAGVKL